MKSYNANFLFLVIVIFCQSLLANDYLAKSNLNTIGSSAPANFTHLQTPFIANKGQYIEDVSFFSELSTGSVFIEKGGMIIYSFPISSDDNSKSKISLTEKLIDANSLQINGLRQSNAKINYIKYH